MFLPDIFNINKRSKKIKKVHHVLAREVVHEPDGVDHNVGVQASDVQQRLKPYLAREASLNGVCARIIDAAYNAIFGDRASQVRMMPAAIVALEGCGYNAHFPVKRRVRTASAGVLRGVWSP